MKFYIPPTLEKDFKDWLEADVAHANYDFELIRDWYAREAEGYEPIHLRALYFSINWKSKIGNSDANSNFKTSYDVKIRKGDIVIREDGRIFMLNWTVQDMPNNQSTQAIICNTMLSFTRHVEETVDDRGFLIEEAHEETIVPPIPCVFAEYAGRPDYMTNYNSPGVSADHLLTVQVQWNERTKQLRTSDEFVLLHSKYRVVDIVGTELDISQEHGILNLMARKVAGEDKP